jgi:predicted negative regulator of RcsB-dependent stress response
MKINKTVKTVAILAILAGGGYYGWKWYKKTSAIRKAKKAVGK